MKVSKPTTPKKKVEYHPLVRRMVPMRILVLAEDYSLGEYVLVAMLIGLVTLVLPIVGLIIYALIVYKQ